MRGDAEFARLRRRGRRADGAHVVIVAAPAQSGRPRLAVVTVKGLGGAVERNRARRRLRAALSELDLLAGGQDLIVTARASAVTADFAQLRDDLRAALVRLRVIA